MSAISAVAPFCLSAALVLGQIFFAGAQPAYAMPMFALSAAGILLAAIAPSRRRSPASALCVTAAALFAVYMLARTAVSPTYHLARENFFNILCAVGVYMATGLALTTPRQRSVIIWSVLILIAPNVLIATIHFLQDPKFTIFQLPRPEYGGRGSGFFICPNHLAGFLEMALPFCLSALFLSRWPIWQRLLAGYLAIVAIYGVFITGSRGGYLSASVAIIVWSLLALWIRGRVNPAGLIKGAVALILAGLILAAGVQHAMQRSPVLRQRFEKLLDFNDFRVHIWPAAIRQFQENPVFGAGAQEFVYYGRKYRVPKIQNDPVHAHSDHLQIVADYGAVGGVLAIFLLGVHFGVGMVRLSKNVRERAADDPGFRSDSVAWSTASLAGLAAIVAHSAVDFNMHIPANAWMAAFLLGILANEGLPRRLQVRIGLMGKTSPVSEDELEETKPPFLIGATRPVLVLLGITLAAVPVSSAHSEYHREMGRLGRRFERYTDAITHATRAVELDPKNGHAWMILGDSKRRLAIRVEDVATRRAVRRSAARDLRRATELLPNDAETWRYYGRVLDTLGRFEEARAALDHALSLDPNLYLSHEFLGWHFNLQGRAEEAEAAYRRSLELYGSQIAREQLEEILSRKARSE